MPNDNFILVMPAYNEADCIKNVVSSWMRLVDKYQGSRMLVINDGSKDNTKLKLDKISPEFKNLTVIHKNNEGHGATVLKGYAQALKTDHDWVFQTDSDDQFTPDDFSKLWNRRNQSCFILGNRSQRNDPLHRLIITRMVRLFNFIMFGTYIPDANIPYRLIKKDYLSAMLKVLPANLFAPNIFLSILAKKDKQELGNISISHKERETGEISIVKWNLIKVCLRGLKELFLFRKNFRSIMKRLQDEK